MGRTVFFPEELSTQLGVGVLYLEKTECKKMKEKGPSPFIFYVRKLSPREVNWKPGPDTSRCGGWPRGREVLRVCVTRTSVPREMAYLMETPCLGLVYKITQVTTEQSPPEGHLCLAL